MIVLVGWFLGIFGTILVVTRWGLRKLWGDIDPLSEISVKDKIVLITGANTGIGKATALEMAKRDAHVIMACRNLDSANAACVEIRKETSRGKLEVMKLDLASLASIRQFAKEFNSQHKELHILINNAGMGLPPNKNMTTEDGFEIHFGVNHLGHFLLTNLLLEPLKRVNSSRVVTVSSMAHNQGKLDFDDLSMKNMPTNMRMGPFDFISALYANSKLANALFSKELAKRLDGTGVRTYCLCPGIVVTDFGRYMMDDIPWFMHLLQPIFKFLLLSPAEGCRTTLYCALSTNCAAESGEMYRHCGFWHPKDRIRLSDEDAKKLWIASEKLVGLGFA